MLVSPGTLAAVDVYVWLTYFQFSSEWRWDESGISILWANGSFENFSYFGSAASRPGHAAEVAVVFPARRLRHGVVMPRTSCPRLTRESPHQLAVPHVSWRQPRTRNTTLGGRPTAARIHRTARVNMCIQISPMESPLVGHVTAGRAALETGCMPTPLQRDAGTIPS